MNFVLIFRCLLLEIWGIFCYDWYYRFLSLQDWWLTDIEICQVKCKAWLNDIFLLWSREAVYKVKILRILNWKKSLWFAPGGNVFWLQGGKRGCCCFMGLDLPQQKSVFKTSTLCHHLWTGWTSCQHVSQLSYHKQVKLVFGDKYIFGNYVEFHFVIGFYYVWNAKCGMFHGVFQVLLFMHNNKGGHNKNGWYQCFDYLKLIN